MRESWLQSCPLRTITLPWFMLQISIGGKIEDEGVIEMDLRSVQESLIQWHKQRGSSCLVDVIREKNGSGLCIHSRVCLHAQAQTHRSSSTKLKNASVLALLQLHFNMRKCKPADGETICVTQGHRRVKMWNSVEFFRSHSKRGGRERKRECCYRTMCRHEAVKTDCSTVQTE